MDGTVLYNRRAVSLVCYLVPADQLATSRLGWGCCMGARSLSWWTGNSLCHPKAQPIIGGDGGNCGHDRCRTNTSFAVSALALHPQHCMAEETRRGLDLLLAQDSLQASNIGHEVAKIVGIEKDRGFFTYFARYDIAFILDLCRRIGASLEDERVAKMVEFVRELPGEYGLWEHPVFPEVSRWLSFDLLRSLSSIDNDTDWTSFEPVTPFQPYPKQSRRY